MPFPRYLLFSVLGILAFFVSIEIATSNTSNQANLTIERQTKLQNRRDILSQLKLTEEQKTEIVGIRNKYQQSIEQSRDELSKSQLQLEEILEANNSADAIRNKYQEVAENRQQLSNLILSRMLEIREVLTPEQRRQFVQIMKHRSRSKGESNDEQNQQSFNF
jgi:Spy/CpxP family protein refolding chaperone